MHTIPALCWPLCSCWVLLAGDLRGVLEYAAKAAAARAAVTVDYEQAPSPR